MKSVSIIGSVGVPARYGGFETLAENLCVNLSERFDIQVFCSVFAYDKQERNSSWNGIKRNFIRIKANGFSSIFYDLISTIKAARRSDILLILGGSAGLFFGLIKMFYPHTKILFHPDGVEWKRSKWNPPTKWFLRLSIEAACRNAHKIILDNEALMNEMYAEYKSKIVFISYGGDQHLKNLGHESSAPYWLTVARAEPENNLDEVAECFASLPAEKWVLLSNISDTRYGRKLKTKFKDFPAIVFAGKTYDSRAMAHLYASARGIIHPHGSGGTNPSLVEAMWSKKVLICHDNVFNRATTHNLCYFFKSAEDLKKLVTGPDLIQKDSLSELANTSYSWKIISEHYARLFNSV